MKLSFPSPKKGTREHLFQASELLIWETKQEHYKQQDKPSERSSTLETSERSNLVILCIFWHFVQNTQKFEVVLK